MVEAFLSRIIRRGPLKKEFVDNPDLDPRIRIRSALLFHFDTHQQPKNPLLGDGERTYTPKQIAKEIRRGTEFGSSEVDAHMQCMIEVFDGDIGYYVNELTRKSHELASEPKTF
ncbi:MAG TPA: hypothetical protein VJC10_03340 [Patescibacteria group bacterium]|nr:hypothetical protein [Patescibacteria group bacterium]